MRRKRRRTPLGVCAAAFFFCCVNGYLQARYLLQLRRFPDDWLTSVPFALGALLFVGGAAINVHSDGILRKLRDTRKQDEGYSIPSGGLFEYVSGANFFGECLE